MQPAFSLFKHLLKKPGDLASPPRLLLQCDCANHRSRSLAAGMVSERISESFLDTDTADVWHACISSSLFSWYWQQTSTLISHPLCSCDRSRWSMSRSGCRFSRERHMRSSQNTFYNDMGVKQLNNCLNATYHFCISGEQV